VLVEVSNRTRRTVNRRLISAVIEKFLTVHRLPRAQVSITVVGDYLMRRLNRQWRGRDRVTDVLSWREQDGPSVQPDFLGEIIIDWPQIVRQARRQGASVKDEFIFILVHGLLHLIGYDDKEESQARQMERLGRRFIAKYFS